MFKKVLRRELNPGQMHGCPMSSPKDHKILNKNLKKLAMCISSQMWNPRFPSDKSKQNHNPICRDLAKTGNKQKVPALCQKIDLVTLQMILT